MKIKTRHTRVDVPSTIQHWKKWIYLFDGSSWKKEEDGVDVTDDIIFEGDKRTPMLAVIFTIDPQAVKGDAATCVATSMVGSDTRNKFTDGMLRVEKSDKIVSHLG